MGIIIVKKVKYKRLKKSIGMHLKYNLKTAVMSLFPLIILSHIALGRDYFKNFLFLSKFLLYIAKVRFRLWLRNGKQASKTKSETLCLFCPTVITVCNTLERLRSLIQITEIRQQDLFHNMNVNKICTIWTKLTWAKILALH